MTLVEKCIIVTSFFLSYILIEKKEVQFYADCLELSSILLVEKRKKQVIKTGEHDKFTVGG